MKAEQEQPELHDLEGLLDRLEAKAQGHEEVSIGMMLEAAGRRSFGPLLLVVGIIPASPLSGVPGLASVVAAVVLLVAGQLLIGRSHFWLPKWLLRRRIASSKFDKAMRFLRPIARFVDRLLRPRLKVFTSDLAIYVIALLSVILAFSMPPLEVVPFANTTSGIALSAFGLALIAHDGLLALLALVFFGIGLWLLVTAFPAA